jgi:diguanylate cyclase (GGDEF)-like protein
LFQLLVSAAMTTLLNSPLWLEAQLSPVQAQIDALNHEAWESRDTDYERSCQLALESRTLSKASGYALGLARSLTVLSYHHYRQGRFEEVIEEASVALPLLELHDDFWLPRIYNNLSLIYPEIGKSSLGIEYLIKQLETSQRLGDRWLEGTAYHDLGIALNNPQETISYLERALAIFREVGDHAGVELGLLNLANYVLQLHEYERARQCVQEALALQKDQKLSWETYAYQTLGRIELAQHQLAAALPRFEAALAVALERERSAVAGILLDMVTCHRDEPELALHYLERALAFCQAQKQQAQVPACHFELSAFYKRQGDFAKALHHLEAFHKSKEALFTEENEQKKRALLVLHRTELAKQEAASERRKYAELSRYALELEFLHRQIKDLSIRDPLTGLYNRRYLFEQLATLQGPITVAILDLDHFKTVNDTFSHQVGDEVLRGVATFLKALLRDSDLAARYGGEEFILVFVDTTLSQAQLACERLRREIERHTWSENHPTLRVTLSIGLAEGYATDATLLTRADQKLYEAKHAGRNRVLF